MNPMTIAFPALIIVYLALAITTAILGIPQIHKPIRLPFKMVTSFGFLVLYTLCRIKTGASPVSLLALPFLFCFLGDLFMGLHDRKQTIGNLILGIVFFALGHLAFLVCFYRADSKVTVFTVLVPLFFFALLLVLIKKLAPSIGKIAPALAAYSLFVSSLAEKAVQMSLSGMHSGPAGALGLGGLLFLFSDLLLFFLIFVRISSEKKLAILSIASLVSYYVSVLLIIVGFIGTGL